MRCQAAMIPEMDLGVVIFSNLHPATLVDALIFRIFDEFIGGEKRDWSREILSAVKKYDAKISEIHTLTWPSQCFQEYLHGYNKLHLHHYMMD